MALERVRRIGGAALAMLLLWASAAGATPCDSIAGKLRTFVKTHPEAAADSGKAEFLSRAMKQSDGGNAVMLAGHAGSGCDGALATIPDLTIDTALRSQLAELGSAFCSVNVTLVDARTFGGFVVLSNQQSDDDCVSVQLLRVEGGRARLGAGLITDGGRVCSFASFHVIRDDQRAFPAILRRNVEGPHQSYELSLFSHDAEAFDLAKPLCRIIVTYQPDFIVKRWSRVDPRATTAPSLRDVMEPILLARARGQDMSPLLERWRDRPSGSSAYDILIRFEDPIIRLTLAGANQFKFESGFWRLSDHAYRQTGGDFMALLIGGRRYLLHFGLIDWGQRNSWRDPGFEIWEWVGHGTFFPVVGGRLERVAARNPEIEASP